MILKNVDLKKYNTFGVSVNSDRFATFSSLDELNQILAKRNKSKILILGGGSNILFTKDFKGFVIKNEIKGFKITNRNNNNVYVKVGAGEIWHEFVIKCIDLGFAGVENLSLIPGSVGASPMQNIGAYGVEVKDLFFELEAYNIETRELKVFSKEECEFGYRDSIFKNKLKDKYIILSVTFKLDLIHKINSSYGAIKDELKKNGVINPTIKDVSDAVIKIRSHKLPNPNKIGNAGSFFKNPIVDIEILCDIKKKYNKIPYYSISEKKFKLAAGWLIEQAGWKGKKFENYGVHKKQALVLVNYSDAEGLDILKLSNQIIKDVKEKFGVILEPEVNIL